MLRTRVHWLLLPAVVAVVVAWPDAADAACCYFSAQNADILQPSQKVFITWDPAKKLESFTVQPKFEGNALDFGMVIPTPTQPKLHEMPREFFKNLAVYSILMRRESPVSKLLPQPKFGMPGGGAAFGGALPPQAAALDAAAPAPKPAVVVLETGVVGSLDYKIISAERADDLFKWLKDNKYSYAGDEATLNFYVQKKWIFTVMKIDTMQMKKNKDGSYAGEVTPTRFQFESEKLCYPLKITQISVKDKTEALFYVQAPMKVDLQGDMSYQHTWVPMLQAAVGCTPGGIQGRGEDWLKAIQNHIPTLLEKGRALGYNFQPGQRPQPNAKGRTPTTMEWARKLTVEDIKILQGKVAYSETVPNVDEGFTQADLKDPQKAEAIYKVIRARLDKAQKDRPFGYQVRHAPKEDIEALQQLAGHLQAGLFITKFRKIFTRDEMNDDLLIVAARLGEEDDFSEYQEILPTSPP
ncbi:MAG TPA: DUF2330 domain-containing protein [Gemmataceae bacterium]|nr:DUF2330 domain-containing protein [Gemmataceae bacterium]